MVQKISPAEPIDPIDMTEIISQLQVPILLPSQCQENLQQQTLVPAVQYMDNLSDTVGQPNSGLTGSDHDIFPETPDTES